MRSSLTNILLALALLALFADIFLRVQPVHANSGYPAYLDQLTINPGQPHQAVTSTGSTVLGFSCADNVCNILSR